MDESSVDEFAAELLGVPSVAALAQGLVSRALLPEGRARAHDGDAENGDSAWAQSQILLRPHLAAWLPKLAALVKRLLSQQDECGGWPLRAGERSSVVFTFYPVLALTRAIRLGLRLDGAGAALAAAERFVEDGLRSGRFSIEGQVLAHVMVERILPVVPADLLRQREQLIDSCWRADMGMRLQDRPITVTRQPVWHSIAWRPLLYLCVRRWVPPLGVLSVLLGGELVNSFDREIAAWRGPEASVNLGSGVSWASALALRGTVALARTCGGWARRRRSSGLATASGRWRAMSTTWRYRSLARIDLSPNASRGG